MEKSKSMHAQHRIKKYYSSPPPLPIISVYRVLHLKTVKYNLKLCIFDLVLEKPKCVWKKLQLLEQ